MCRQLCGTLNYKDMEQKFFTINEAVAHLNAIGYPITKSTMYKKTMANEIPFSRFGGRKIIFSREQLEEWAEAQLTDPTAEMEAMTKRVAENARRKEGRA